MARFPFDPLPDGFVLGKPVDRHSYDERMIYELEQRGDLIITRKRDGWKIYTAINRGRVRLYTAGGSEIDERLDHVKNDLLCCDVPSPALIAGEGIIDIIHDDIGKVGSIFNANLKRSLELQEEYGKIRFMPFGLVHWGGKSVIGDPYEKNLARLGPVLSRFYGSTKGRLTYITPIHILTMSFDEAKKLVIEKGWEGLVLYDRNFANSFVLDGTSPDRPSGCYKWKPVFEDDFIARSWIPSPKDPLAVRDVMLFQKDPITGKEFPCGKFGTFSKKLKKELADDSKYPFVIQLEFDARYPKSGKIRSPRYVRIRTDKKVEDCIAPKSYPVR